MKFVIALVSAAVSVTACAGSVQLDPAPQTQLTEAVCASVVGKLPITVDGYRRANTTPKSSSTAAWGPPFITLRCGVQTPSALRPDSQLITVNGVDWFAEKLTNGTVFTTVGREANVEVVVPADVVPAVNVVTDICETVRANDPLLPD